MFLDTKSKNTFIASWFPFYKTELKSFVFVWTMVVLVTFVNIALWNILQTTVIKETGPDHLPLLYAGSSVCILIGSIVLSLLQKIFRVLWAGVMMFLISIVSLAIGTILLQSPDLLWWYVGVILLVNSALLGSIFTSAFNILHDVLTPSQTKRWISWTGTAGIIGGIIGGFFLDYGSHILSPLVIHIILIMILVIGMMLFGYWKKLWPSLIQSTRSIKADDEVANTREAYSTIFKTPFLWTLGLTLLLSMLFTRIFNYTFAITADATYTNEADLVSFFGKYTMYFYIASLVFGTNISKRLTRKFGLTGGMYLPIIIVGIGTTGTIIWPGILSVSINLFIRDLIVGFQNSLITLLMSGLPNRIHNALWLVFDGHVGMVGGIIGAGVLWFFQIGFTDWTFIQQIYALSTTAIVLLIIRWWLTSLTRRSYLSTIEKNISTGDEASRIRALEAFTERQFLPTFSLSKVLDLLKNNNEPMSVRVKAAETIGQLHDPSTLRVLKNLLSHNDPTLRIAVIRSLAEFNFEKLPFNEAGLSRQATIESLETLLERTASANEFGEIMQTLGALGDPKLAEKIEHRTHDTREEYVVALLGALKKIKDPAVIDYAKPFLDSTSVLIVHTAIEAIWQFEWEREKIITLIDKYKTKWTPAILLDLYYKLGIGDADEVIRAWNTGSEVDKRSAVRLAWALNMDEALSWSEYLLQTKNKDAVTILSDSYLRDHIVPHRFIQLTELLKKYTPTEMVAHT